MGVVWFSRVFDVKGLFFNLRAASEEIRLGGVVKYGKNIEVKADCHRAVFSNSRMHLL